MAVTSRVIEGGRTTITQPYHINGQKGYSYDHWGIDLTGFNGSYNVLAWELAHSDGVVVEARNNCKGFEDNSYGNYVKLKHANGMFTLYAHMAYNTVQVKVGQSVEKGQRLGYMGNTGTSYGGHLHFEVRRSDNYKIDPEPYLDKDLPGLGHDYKWEQKWFLYDNGKMVTGWAYVNSRWYYMNSSGAMVTGWQYLNWSKGKDWFYFEDNGIMVTGWQYLSWSKGKNWFYFEADGNMTTGWKQLDWSGGKNWFYFDGNGVMVTGRQVIDGKIYYFDDNGCWIE